MAPCPGPVFGGGGSAISPPTPTPGAGGNFGVKCGPPFALLPFCPLGALLAFPFPLPLPFALLELPFADGGWPFSPGPDMPALLPLTLDGTPEGAVDVLRELGGGPAEGPPEPGVGPREMLWWG